MTQDRLELVFVSLWTTLFTLAEQIALGCWDRAAMFHRYYKLLLERRKHSIVYVHPCASDIYLA